MTGDAQHVALSRGQRLAADAAGAAEVRAWQTHPDVVALRVERIRTRVDRMLWAGIVLGLLFTMVNVQTFAASDAERYSLAWWAAWLLDPTVSVILLGVLIAEREVSRGQIVMGGWTRAAKWSLLTATYVMNTWESYAAGSASGIVLHSVPPLVVFMAAEAVTDCHDKLTEYVHRTHQGATDRAESARSVVPAAATPIPPLPVRPEPATRTGPPVRPASTSADRSASATRTSPAGHRQRPAQTRSDAQLSRAVRELAAQTGAAPSQYQIKARFGVGSGRAARLLAELGDLTPPGPLVQSNGAATRKEGA